MSITLSVIVAVLMIVVAAGGFVIVILVYSKKQSREASSSTMDFELTVTTANEKMMVDHYSCIEDVTTYEAKCPIYDTPDSKEELPTADNVAYGNFNEIA